MHRAGIAVVVAVALAVGSGGVAVGSAGAATATVGTPTGVKVTPRVGGVTVSWNAVAGSSVTYSVTSSPTGASCSVVNQTSCTVPDLSSTPFTFTVVATEFGLNPSAPSPATAPLAPHLVLVVAGQSNANGYGSYPVDPVTTVNYFAAPYVNGADSHDLVTWLPWSQLPGAGGVPVPLDATQQIGATTGPTAIFGPEIGLARQLWTDTGRSATIVKAAYSGTSLATNWSPTKKGTAPTGLFPAMVSKVTSVLAADAAAGQFDVLGGFYWYQGESDVTKPGWANNYRTHLTAFIAAVRADLPMSPSAPVVLAKQDLTQYIGYIATLYHLTAKKDASLLAGNNAVRAADDWAAANIAGVTEVDTLPLPRLAPLYVHLDNVAELSLGDQMAKVSDKLLP